MIQGLLVYRALGPDEQQKSSVWFLAGNGGMGYGDYFGGIL